MQTSLAPLIAAFALLLLGCTTPQLAPLEAMVDAPQETSRTSAEIASPSGQLQVSLHVTDGSLSWSATWRDEPVIEPSQLGLVYKTGRDLNQDLIIQSTANNSHDSSWEQPWGERQFVRDHHNELLAEIAFSDGTPAFALRIRVFDDGLGFRYEVPDTDARRNYSTNLLSLGSTRTRSPGGFPAAGWNRYEELV
jgi:alpha-glucosidase